MPNNGDDLRALCDLDADVFEVVLAHALTHGLRSSLSAGWRAGGCVSLVVSILILSPLVLGVKRALSRSPSSVAGSI
jgi:hypothetical protein